MLRHQVKHALLLVLLLISGGAWAGDAHWIDVRTAEEFAAWHISQAVNIPYDQITDRIGEVTVDKDAPIYLYCRSGHRAGIARESLSNAGYRNVVNIGGLEDARNKAAEVAAAGPGPAG